MVQEMDEMYGISYLIPAAARSHFLIKKNIAVEVLSMKLVT